MNAINIFEIFGTIGLKDEGFDKGISDATNKGESFGSKFGDVMAGVGNAAAIGLGAAATAFGALAIGALKSGGDLEQSLGGIETLFKGSADTVIANAERAYLTAGVNANDYMQQVTSFSASLLQSLDGDTEAAAKAADTAVIDMADNANKMGSSVESIQNAYQGFAKGNYGMLDNLKLGFGGTKEEMQRLLAEAGKISGMEYDISNLNDVYSAVHVIQDELGITGTTAKEGMETLNGAAMTAKASWENFLSGASNADAFIASSLNLVDVVVQNLMTLLPRLTTGLTEIVAGLLPKIPELFSTLLPAVVEGASSLINGLISALPAVVQVITDSLPEIVNAFLSMLPLLLQAGVDIITSLITGIASMLPELIPIAVETVTALVQGLVDSMPLLLDAALALITGLATGIIAAIPVLVAKLPEIILSIVNYIVSAIPKIVETGIKLLTSLVEALPEIINTIVEVLPEIINSVISALLDALPEIIEAGVTLLTALVENLPFIITTIIDAVPKIVISVADALIANIDKIIDAGVSLFIALVENLPTIITAIVAAVPQIITALVSAFTQIAPKIVEVGENLIKGVWNGISNTTAWLREKISGFFGGVVDDIKQFFGIASPSKLFEKEIGAQLPAGMAEGIEKNMSKAEKAAAKMSKATYDSAKLWIKDYQNNTDYLASEEIKMWETLGKKYAASSKERIEADTNVKNLQAKALKEQQAQEKAAFENSINWIEVKKKLGLLSVEDEIAAYKRMQEQYATGSEYRNKIDIALYETQKKQNEEQTKMFENQQGIIDKMADAEQKYQTAVDNRAAAIMKSFGAFDELKKHEEISTTTMIKNLNDQSTAMDKWASMMQTLSDKGVNEGLLSDLQGMGSEAMPYLQSLTSMTETELKKYSDKYGEMQNKARKDAEFELQGMRKDTNEEIKGLAADLDGLAGTKFVEAGKNTAIGFINGIQSKLDDLKAAGKAMGQAVSDGTAETLEIASPSKLFKRFGAFTGQGFIDGVKGMSSAVENAVNGVFGGFNANNDIGISSGISAVHNSNLPSQAQSIVSTSTQTGGNTFVLQVKLDEISDVSKVVQIFKQIEQQQYAWG